MWAVSLGLLKAWHPRTAPASLCIASTSVSIPIPLIPIFLPISTLSLSSALPYLPFYPALVPGISTLSDPHLLSYCFSISLLSSPPIRFAFSIIHLRFVGFGWAGVAPREEYMFYSKALPELTTIHWIFKLKHKILRPPTDDCLPLGLFGQLPMLGALFKQVVRELEAPRNIAQDCED